MTTTGTTWETVIGLEVHVELGTETKLFCSCPNRFGEEPNTNVCPVCLGLPGSLPVLNARAVEYAARIGVALHCTVQPSLFHRKNYFYPDMPKDYQISQYDVPIDADGWLELPGGTRVGIERAHLEEDTGKTTHLGGGGRIHDADHSLVDYNRAGVPLVEIVSRPDLRSADDARAYVDELRGILVAAGVSDGKMEEGSLRVDANVSVRPAGSERYGTRCEIKNMNSLRSLGRAIDYEAARQVQLLEGGGTVTQETRHWNEDEGRTSSMRSKEEAFDYRYFPEPDLVPLRPDPAWLDDIRASLPPMPADVRRKVAEAAGMAPDVDAVITVVRLGLDPYVDAAVRAGADGNLAVRRLANEVAADAASVGNLAPAAFVALLRMESAGELTTAQAREVLKELLASGGDPAAIAAARGFEALGEDALAAALDQVIADNADAWARFVGGEDKLQGLFIGRLKGATGGKADLAAAAALLRARRAAGS
ncbi:Asp-tRNA(Asn)/Glu-tRNA(Gln) amidotransferase subunit GatB [Acidimicrobiaceae bacterium USS-CC1]|uniref:Aspartyl/glutamyl-tRNA(Asn/Gln) amidotransferase subunit B n=1 Tax=Acidiferrimicrobium australe TaxID=2664430 RepID=A0ABW9QRL1_9ACTN|nr:Asp-tRNA(Asn)/Glu-tRNA(Gln) amidotransferase subunit GatB [Acidiferrimicrobium australe]